MRLTHSLYYIFVLISLARAEAGESLFGRAFTTDVAKPGELEFLVQSRLRESRALGNYDAVDVTASAEYGISDGWQGALVLGMLRIDAAGAPDEGDPSGATGFNRRGWYARSLAAEFAHEVFDVERDGWGLSVVGEAEALFHAPQNGLAYDSSFAVGFRAVTEKHFFDDRLIAVYNLALEYETVRFAGSDERHDKSDWNNEIGLAWAFAANLYAGFELRNHNAYVDFEHREHTVFWLGPTLSYRGQSFWVSFSWLEQIYGTPSGVRDSIYVGNGLSLLEHERREITVKLGVPL